MRLFSKIFLSFWLVMILVLVTNLTVTWIQALNFESGEQSEHVAVLAKQAIQHYQQDGVDGLKHWRRKLHRKTHLRIILLNNNKLDVTGRPLPPHVNALLHGRLEDFYRGRQTWRGNDRPKHLFFRKFDRPALWPVTTEQGQTYNFVVLNPHEISDHLYGYEMIFWRVIITGLVVALFALALSIYLVKPVRALQLASRKLAEGDLSSRAGKQVVTRRDEIGELGQDFDAMANKIQALLESQQRLLRDVSHELRSPLARLRMALEIARKRSGESNELDRMELEAERINDLIDDILQLVRLKTSLQQLICQNIDLATLLRQLADNANLGPPRVIVKTENNAQFSADPKLLNRALNSIIENALKYSEGNVELTGTAVNDEISIHIRDHGSGVDDSLLDKLFIPFFRADEARHYRTGGYGLGLAIAAQSVQAHNGNINAQNHPDGGLDVHIRLPIA